MNSVRAAGLSLVILLPIISFHFAVVRGQSTSPKPRISQEEQEEKKEQVHRPTLVWQQAEQWPVNAIAFSPDGRMLASGSEHSEVQSPGKHAVKLWDVQTGKMLKTFVAANTSINALSFSPDGKLLAGGGTGRTLLLWDVETGQMTRKLPGHTDWVKDIDFSPDGKTLASGGVDNTIRLWNIATGKLEHTMVVGDATKHSSLDHYSVHGVAFSPDGQTVAGAYFYDRTVRLWDVPTGKLVRTLPQAGEKARPHVTTVAFSPDGKTLACGQGMSVLSDGGEDKKYGNVVLWGLDSGKKLQNIQNHQSYVHSLAYSPNAKALVTGGDEGTVQLHDLRSGRTGHILHGRAGKGNGDRRKEIRAVAFSPDGKYVAGGDVRGFIKMWRITAD